MLRALLFTSIPLGLIMLQPDFGTAMVIVVTLLGVIATSGAPTRWVVGLIISGVLFGGAVLQFHLLKPYQEARLTAFANPHKNLGSTGYNVNQAKTANASGGLLGKGLFHGPQTQGQFVPEQQTDFVFTVAGEELGFVGGGGLLLVFGLVLWRSLTIAARAPDAFGRLVAVRGRVLVVVPGIRQRRHDAGDHAGDRPAAAVRFVRRILDVRQHAGARAAAERPAAFQLTLLPARTLGTCLSSRCCPDWSRYSPT